MPFEIYDPVGVPFGVVEDENEYQWTDMFDGSGSFTITMPNTRKNIDICRSRFLVRNVETDTVKQITSILKNRDSITIGGKDIIVSAAIDYTEPERSFQTRRVADLVGSLCPIYFIPGSYNDAIQIALPCLTKYDAIILVLSTSGFGIEQGVSESGPYVALAKYGETPAVTFSTADGSIQDWQVSETTNEVCNRGIAYGSFEKYKVESAQYMNPNKPRPELFPVIAEDIGSVPYSEEPEAYTEFKHQLSVKAQEIYEKYQGTGELVEYTVNPFNKPYMIGQYARFEIPEIAFSEVRRIDGRQISASIGSKDEKIITGRLFR